MSLIRGLLLDFLCLLCYFVSIEKWRGRADWRSRNERETSQIEVWEHRQIWKIVEMNPCITTDQAQWPFLDSTLKGRSTTMAFPFSSITPTKMVYDDSYFLSRVKFEKFRLFLSKTLIFSFCDSFLFPPFYLRCIQLS